MKLAKSAFLIVVILVLIVTSSTSTLAGTDGGFVIESNKPSSKESPYIMMFSETEGKYITYENPNYPRINKSMNKQLGKQYMITLVGT